MKSRLLLSVGLLLCLAGATRAQEEEEEDGPTICTSPTGTCYAGSQLLSDQGTQYYSFQGIRSVTFLLHDKHDLLKHNGWSSLELCHQIGI